MLEMATLAKRDILSSGKNLHSISSACLKKNTNCDKTNRFRWGVGTL